MAFFRKKRVEQPLAEKNTFLAGGSRFEGKLSTDRTVALAGDFKGFIIAGKELSMENGSTFSGEATSGIFSLYGKAKGNFNCRLAQFFPGSHWEGKLSAKKLQVAKGAELTGEIKENLNR